MKQLRNAFVDRKRHEITIDDVLIILSPKQFEILALIVEKNGALVTRAKIMKDIWGHPDNHITKRTVDQHVHRLRDTLERLGIRKRVIQTVPVLGYKFDRFK